MPTPRRRQPQARVFSSHMSPSEAACQPRHLRIFILEKVDDPLGDERFPLRIYPSHQRPTASSRFRTARRCSRLQRGQSSGAQWNRPSLGESTQIIIVLMFIIIGFKLYFIYLSHYMYTVTNDRFQTYRTKFSGMFSGIDLEIVLSFPPAVPHVSMKPCLQDKRPGSHEAVHTFHKPSSPIGLDWLSTWCIASPKAYIWRGDYCGVQYK